ncbi:MAG: SIMPL domain-containing protein [Desulfotalea sp.]
MKIFNLILSLVLFASSQVYASSLPDAPHIVVSGFHKFNAVPDTLTMSLEIIEIGRDAKSARKVVEERSTKLIQTVKGMGVNKKDINSSALSMNPKYNWKNQQQIYTGTEVSRRIILILRDLSKYDELIQAVLDSSVARINSTDLSSSKHDELLAKAMRLAVADAQRKASLLVGGLEQKVGPVYSINAASGANFGSRNMQYEAVEMKSASGSVFEPGEIEFNKSVQVVFYLVNR